jgi:hypothetical protein
MYWDLKPTEASRSQWLIDMLGNNSSDQKCLTYILKGRHVCRTAFIGLLGISQAKLNRLHRHVASGFVPPHGNVGLLRSGQANKATTSWLRTFFTFICERMPHQKKMYVPVAMKKVDIYRLCCREMPRACLVTYQYFLHILTHKFPNVVFSKQTFLGKCDTCLSLIDARLNTNSADTEKVEVYRLTRQKHLEFVLQEREAYYARKKMAKDRPHEYMSIIIDYTDKLYLPWRHTPPKRWRGKSRLPLNLFGIIDHGNRKRMLYAHHPSRAQDVNSVLSMLWDYLCSTLPSIPLHLRPKTLYLQADNCYRENKNRFMLAFCSLLVYLGVFDSVQLSLLPPGHTHEDIDQMFSTLRLGSKKCNFYTLESMVDFISSSYPTLSTRPHLKVLDIVSFSILLCLAFQHFLILSNSDRFGIGSLGFPWQLMMSQDSQNL